MTTNAGDQMALEDLDGRLRTVLPAEYQDSYETVQPVSMGSAGLKFDADGRVAWDQMWGSFCDLAMAGGPPHKGALLQAGTFAAVEEQPARYQEVVDEICRGVTLVTGLPADAAPAAGWVRLPCYSEVMASWLLRAIAMENVAVRAEGKALDLPASPDFRLEKEIKNVITVIAKTSHYWLGHMSRAQHRAITALFATLAIEAPLVEPAWSPAGRRSDADAPAFMALADRVHHDTGLRSSAHTYEGWLGLECPSVRAAVWMMRALVVCNVLARREGTVLFVPVNPATDPQGARVAAALAGVHRLAATRAWP